MRVQTNLPMELVEETPGTLGSEWIETVDECAMTAWGNLKLEELPRFGISNQQVVSYLDTAQSSKENMFNNGIALIEAPNGSFKIFNNVESLLTKSLSKECGEDGRCAAYFALCFGISSGVFNCTDDLSAESSRFVPRQDQIVTADFAADLVGEAFTLDYDTCYVATPILNRIDRAQALYLNDESSKRILVVDAGLPP